MEMNMHTRSRLLILRADALFLIIASIGGAMTDVAGSLFGSGPEVAILSAAPAAGIGFLEAHGLALILGILFWRATPAREWHLTAAAVHALLGSANLAFWQFFVITDLLAVGYVTTALHGLFVVLQLWAAFAVSGRTPTPETA
jgi:hypothetical protein